MFTHSVYTQITQSENTDVLVVAQRRFWETPHIRIAPRGAAGRASSPGHILYLSESCPDTKDPSRTPTKNREVLSGAFQSLSHTRFHCGKENRKIF